MELTYCDDDGINRTTDNVYIDWPDGVCWLVVGAYGVIGAVIAMPSASWEEVYEIAVDEIAHDFDAEGIPEGELEGIVRDGTVTLRGGEPSNPNRSGLYADTMYFGIRRALPMAR